MPISSIGPGAAYAPPPEFSAADARFAERRVPAAQQAEVPLPGGGAQAPFEEWDAGGKPAAADRIVDRRMQFIVDRSTSDIIVKVIDNATEEVVKVLPPEELQRSRKPQEAGGRLLNELA
jgi:hypothetical protein